MSPILIRVRNMYCIRLTVKYIYVINMV